MAYSKKIFIIVLICLHVSPFLFAQKHNKYNVLFLISDDLRPEIEYGGD